MPKAKINPDLASLSFTLVDKLYVGISGRKPFDTVEYPLGFAVPHGTTAAHRKRRETVDNWVGGRTSYPIVNGVYDYKNPIDNGVYEGTVIDNVPLPGFMLDKVVTRYETKNKLFRIFDPRGFALEITAMNLADILLSGTIEKGLLVGDYIWVRGGGAGNYLLSAENPIYTSLITPEDDTPEIGDTLYIGGGESQYLGDFFKAEVQKITLYQKRDGTWVKNYPYDDYRSWAWNGNQQPKAPIKEIFERTKDTKKWKIFASDFEKKNNKVTAYRSFPKNKIVRKNDPIDFNPLNAKVEYTYRTQTFLFATKAELAAFDIDSVNF